MRAAAPRWPSRSTGLSTSCHATKATGRERILVLVTDGQVGNEDQILRHLGQRLKGIRVFTLGIDRAVNAAFLRRLADLGGGRSELVESEDRLDEVMDSVHRHIGTPVLTGLRLEPAGLKFQPESVVPGRMPDLFAGTPLLLSGRYRGDADGAIALQARDAAGQMWSAEVRGRRVDNPALTTVWARGRLREMEDRYVIGTDNPAALEREIVATSLRFGVLVPLHGVRGGGSLGGGQSGWAGAWHRAAGGATGGMGVDTTMCCLWHTILHRAGAEGRPSCQENDARQASVAGTERWWPRLQEDTTGPRRCGD